MRPRVHNTKRFIPALAPLQKKKKKIDTQERQCLGTTFKHADVNSEKVNGLLSNELPMKSLGHRTLSSELRPRNLLHCLRVDANKRGAGLLVSAHNRRQDDPVFFVGAAGPRHKHRFRRLLALPAVVVRLFVRFRVDLDQGAEAQRLDVGVEDADCVVVFVLLAVELVVDAWQLYVVGWGDEFWCAVERGFVR